MEISQLLDLYQRRKAERGTKIDDFFQGKRKYLLIQRPPSEMWGACNSIEQIYANNIRYVEQQLELPWTDELPYLEPWIGTGIYATAFGCEYKWRDDNAPDVHYRYHKIEEVRGIEKPDYRNSVVMQMALDCIDTFLERTRGGLPICVTDTQSPFDTASLILDAAVFLEACYNEPETVHHFMQVVTDLIIEFSQVQMEHIGAGRVAKPGHIMPASPTYRGISLSDDNLSFCSPVMNEKIPLKYDQQIADAFGGLAIHSCGVWDSTMKRVTGMRNVVMVDCAVSPDCDPNPNQPARVRNAMQGSGIILKARVGGHLEASLKILDELVEPTTQLVVEFNYDPSNAQANYHALNEKLANLYAA
jgi:hypothetical protein